MCRIGLLCPCYIEFILIICDLYTPDKCEVVEEEEGGKEEEKCEVMEGEEEEQATGMNEILSTRLCY